MSNVVQKSFARAVFRSTIEENQTYLFPSVFVGNGKDYLDLLTEDNFDSYSFIRVNDEKRFEEDTRTVKLKRWQLNIDVIVWLDLNRADLSKSGDYTPDFIDIAITAINNSSLQAVEVVAVYDEPERVFDRYTLNLVQTQRLYYPNSCFRLNLDVIHPDNC
ncbi:hypothetical protein EP331_00230 [bacterium]|nr:MAG: hypothetical protein EP331_00230 [bacterium]